jgi:TRAP-type C4-dicarboxylate transport system permease small subunit
MPSPDAGLRRGRVAAGLSGGARWICYFAIFLILAFAASGYGLRTGHHFRVNLMSEHFPRLVKPLGLLSGLLETVFGAILLIAGSMQSYGAFAQDLRSDTLLQIPQGWPLLAFPIGGLAIALQGLAHLMAQPQAGAEL